MTLDRIMAVGDACLVLAVVAAVGFLTVYTVLARWWETREGWYLWVSSLVFAGLLTYNLGVIMGWAWADPWVRAWTRAAMYAACLVVMCWRGVLLILAQLQGSVIVLAQFEPHRREK